LPPDDLDVGSYHPLIVRLALGIKNHLETIDHIKTLDGQPLVHNTASLPYGASNRNRPYLAIGLNYVTLEEGRTLNGGHSATATRTDGSLRCNAFEFVRLSIDETNFFETILFDVQPVAIPYERTLSDLVGGENASVIMASWTKNFLTVLNEDENVIVALGAHTASDLFSANVFGDEKELGAQHKTRPGKYISAYEDTYKPGIHPEAMYNRMKQSNMEAKSKISDAFYAACKAAMGDSTGCDFARDFTNENSHVFAFFQRVHLTGCRRGGKTSAGMRTAASKLYREQREDGASCEAALSTVRSELSDDHYNLLSGSMEGGKTSAGMETAASNLYHEQRGDGASHEAALSAVRSELSDDHANLLIGAMEGGNTSAGMRTAALKLYHEQCAEGASCEAALATVRSELSDDQCNRIRHLVTNTDIQSAASANNGRNGAHKHRLTVLLAGAKKRKKNNPNTNTDELFFEFECKNCNNNARSYGPNNTGNMKCWDQSCRSEHSRPSAKKTQNKHWIRHGAVAFSVIQKMRNEV
jgi:hypothetical protein